MQCGDQAIGYSGVVVDQLGKGGKTALRRHIHLKESRRRTETKSEDEVKAFIAR